MVVLLILVLSCLICRGSVSQASPLLPLGKRPRVMR